MSLKPRQLLEFAESLEVEAGETHVRAAISRAYYAALLRAAQVTPSEFRKSPADRIENTHAQVIAAVERYAASLRPGRTLARQVAQNLTKLRADRVNADYHLETDITAIQAKTHLARARITLEWCDDIFRSLATQTPGN